MRKEEYDIPDYCDVEPEEIHPGADLSGREISDANLTNANLENADLSGVNLKNTNLSEANLAGATLSGANLSNVDFIDANLSDADLSEADLRMADLTMANLQNCDLSESYIGQSDMSNLCLRGADLSGATLPNTDLTGSNLRAADLSHADLTRVEFREADLSKAKVHDVELKDASLVNADFTDADLSEDVRRYIELSQTSLDKNNRPVGVGFISFIEEQRPEREEFIFDTVGAIFILGSWTLARSGDASHSITSTTIVTAAITLYLGSMAYLHYVHTELPDVLRDVIPVAESPNQDTIDFVSQLSDEMSLIPLISSSGSITRKNLAAIAVAGFTGLSLGHWLIIMTTSLDHTLDWTKIDTGLWLYLTVTSFVLGVAAGAILIRATVIAYRLGIEFNVSLDLNQFYVNDRLGLEPYGKFLTRSSTMLVLLSIIPILTDRVFNLVLLDLLAIVLIGIAITQFGVGQLGFHYEIIRAKEARLLTLQADHRSEIFTVFSEEQPDIDSETIEKTESVVQIRNHIKNIPEWPANIKKLTRFVGVVVIPFFLKFLP